MIRTENELQQCVRTLENDLSTLLNLIVKCNQPLTDGDIRLSSVILRKWLIDGLLNNMAYASKSKLTFPVLDNSHLIDNIKNVPDINYFLTGGIKMDDEFVAGLYHSASPQTGTHLLSNKPLQYIEVKLSKLLKQRRMYFEGEYFTCEDIIKFTANKLGGAHLDFNRKGTYEKIEKAAAFMTFGGPVSILIDKPGEVHLELEPKSKEALSAVHIEIMAAASSFLSLHVDDIPFLDLEYSIGLKSLIRRFFRKLLRGNERFRFYDV